MGDVQVAAEQLAGKIGIGMAWIQKRDPIAQVLALGIELCDLLILLSKQSLVLVPGDKPAGPGNDKAGHEQQGDKRAQLDPSVPHKFRFTPVAAHGSSSTTFERNFQQNRCEPQE
jgi:hypothetical protein